MLAVLLCLTALAALLSQFIVNRGDHPEDSAALTIWKMARYFTILTNALVLATYLKASVTNRAPGAAWGAAVTSWITITGVAYYALLYAPSQGLGFWSDMGLHGAVPLGAVLWWLAFGDKHGVTVRAAARALLYPAGYLVYALVRGLIDGRFPYFFLDPSKVGWPGVFIWSAALCFAFFLVGLVLVGVARVTRRT